MKLFCHCERPKGAKQSENSRLLRRPFGVPRNDMDSRGFTLIEMLLAVTLFAIVMTSGFGVFRMGIQIWQRMQERSSIERKTLVAFEKIGRELRGAIRLPKQSETLAKPSVEYGGTQTEVSFPAVITKAGKKGETTQVGRITYRFDSSGKNLCKKMENATDLYLKKNVACEPLAREIKTAQFRYWLYDKIGKEYAWYDEWEMDQGLPKAVSLSLVQNPKKEYKQTWVIPAGGGHLESEG